MHLLAGETHATEIVSLTSGMELPYNRKAMEPSSSSPTKNRPPGRPRRADAPVVPWDEVDRALVFGEKVTDPETQRSELMFPSFLELAKRYGVSKNRIWQYSTKNKCLERRKECQLREQVRCDRIVTARRAEARALSIEDVVQIIDDYISGFREAVNEGKVRFDNPTDLDRLVRLKELMLGNADSRQEIQGGLTLDAIQERHQRVRDQVDSLTPELEGTAKVSGEGGGKDELH